jgi:membrane fusion protein, multidrug efflux system
MKKIIGVVVLLVAAVAGYFVWLEMRKTESTDDAQIDGQIVAVSPRVSGHVLEVLVADQQEVKKGDVLFRLDPKDYEVAVQKARADLEDAVASLQTFRGDVPLTSSTTSSVLNAAKSGRQDTAVAVTWNERQLGMAQARVATLQANVKVAEANATKASQDLERYRVLVAKDEISKQQYDQAVAASEAAKATVEAARAAVVEAQRGIAVAEMAVEQAKAKLAQADANVETAMTGPQQVAITESRVKAALAKVAQHKAALEQAELNLSYTTIVAPVNGVVGRKSVEPGQNLAAGQQTMALVSLDDVWVTANFKETQLRDIKVGQAVKIEVDATGREYSGKILRFAGASGARFSLLPPENATGNFVKVVQRIPVRIQIDPGQNEDHSLRPGMSVVPAVRIRS